MLVLTRKKGESIMIGDQIELIVLDTEGDAVRLGIRAPKEIAVFRKEIYEAIQETNREASKASIDLNQLSRLFGKRE